MANFIDNPRPNIFADLATRSWETGSLHPSVLNNIGQALTKETYFGFLRYQHQNPLESVKDKLAALNHNQDEIVQALLTASPGFSYDAFKNWNPTFYAAKTFNL